MIRRVVAAAALAALMPAYPLVACTCGGVRPFVQAAQRAVVVHGIVRRYVTAPEKMHPVAMDVEVRDVLQGNFKAKTIRIVGDFGASCVPYVDNFPIGSEWVFAVGGPIEVRGFGDENFSFGPCASPGVRVNEDHVLVNGVKLTIDQLRDFLCEPAAFNAAAKP